MDEVVWISRSGGAERKDEGAENGAIKEAVKADLPRENYFKQDNLSGATFHFTTPSDPYRRIVEVFE